MHYKEAWLSQIEGCCETSSGQCGLVVLDITNGIQVAHNPGKSFLAASLIKLPVMYHFGLRVQDGELDPQQRLSLREEDKVPGFGVLRDLAPGCLLTTLRRQQFRTKLPALTADPGRWAHKTGELDDADHDAGFLFIDDSAIIVTILSCGGSGKLERVRCMLDNPCFASPYFLFIIQHARPNHYYGLLRCLLKRDLGNAFYQ